MRKNNKKNMRNLLMAMAITMTAFLVFISIYACSRAIIRSEEAIEEADAFISRYEEEQEAGSRTGIEASAAVLKTATAQRLYVNYDGSYGNCYTYMGYFLITCEGSSQLEWKESHDWYYDSEGFARYRGCYIVATRPYFGNIGDELTFYLKNGEELHCIIGDWKADDPNAIMYGHIHGGYISVVEFCVSEDWYDGHCNPGTYDCHPEWKSLILYAEKEARWAARE